MTTIYKRFVSICLFTVLFVSSNGLASNTIQTYSSELSSDANGTALFQHSPGFYSSNNTTVPVLRFNPGKLMAFDFEDLGVPTDKSVNGSLFQSDGTVLTSSFNFIPDSGATANCDSSDTVNVTIPSSVDCTALPSGDSCSIQVWENVPGGGYSFMNTTSGQTVSVGVWASSFNVYWGVAVNNAISEANDDQSGQAPIQVTCP